MCASSSLFTQNNVQLMLVKKEENFPPKAHRKCVWKNKVNICYLEAQ